MLESDKLSAQRFGKEHDPRTTQRESKAMLVARNRQMSLNFRQADNGVVRDVLVTYVKPVEVNGRRVSR
jgi:hypothetical protein